MPSTQRKQSHIWVLFSINQRKCAMVQKAFLHWSSSGKRSQRGKGQRGQQQQVSPPHPPTWSWPAVDVGPGSAPSFYPLTLVFVRPSHFPSILPAPCKHKQIYTTSQQQLRNVSDPEQVISSLRKRVNSRKSIRVFTCTYGQKVAVIIVL